MSPRSLSLQATNSFASATDAIVVSSALRSLPFALPFAMMRAQSRAEFPSYVSARPASSEERPGFLGS